MFPTRRAFLKTSSLMAWGLTLPGAPTFHLTARESAPLALSGAPARVPSIQSLEEFQLRMAAASKTDKQEQRAVIEGAAQPKSDQPGLLDFVQRTAAQTYASS